MKAITDFIVAFFLFVTAAILGVAALFAATWPIWVVAILAYIALKLGGIW